MDQIYKKIWFKAQPLYLRGRTMDIPHIKWMMEKADVVANTDNLEKTILLPLVILHDIGYSVVEHSNPFNLDIRTVHMQEGARIAEEILYQLDYPLNKSKKIVSYVSIHDQWALGNNGVFMTDPILGTFNDLDFIWMATPKGFSAVSAIRKCSGREMFQFLATNEKLKNRPFHSLTTKKMFDDYMKDRKEAL